MELTNKELGYLMLYKGYGKGIKYVYSDSNSTLAFFNESFLRSQSLNMFLNFIFTKDVNMITKFGVYDVDSIIEMVLTISDLACRSALESNYDNLNLYRMESNHNLNNYQNNTYTTSFKSFTRSPSKLLIFNYPDSTGLSYKMDSFVPFVEIDKYVPNGYFSEEREVLIPPCIDFIMTENKTDESGITVNEIQLDDEFGKQKSIEQIQELYNKIKLRFTTALSLCRKSGEMSEELNTYCDIISTYLSVKLRNMYNEYSIRYNNAKRPVNL